MIWALVKLAFLLLCTTSLTSAIKCYRCVSGHNGTDCSTNFKQKRFEVDCRYEPKRFKLSDNQIQDALDKIREADSKRDNRKIELSECASFRLQIRGVSKSVYARFCTSAGASCSSYAMVVPILKGCEVCKSNLCNNAETLESKYNASGTMIQVELVTVVLAFFTIFACSRQ